MNRASTAIAVVALGAGSIAGPLYWRARRASPTAAAPLNAGQSPQPLPASAAAPPDMTAPATAPEPNANREQLASDVAARLAASMAASKARPDAAKPPPPRHPPPDL